MKLLGELKRLDVRSVWKTEARDFTPWLADNLDVLGEVLGMDLELVEREASVGGFSLDILAKDLGTGHAVVIENQFNQTDHDHLGKLLTYAAGFEAGAVIWIAERIREEHRQGLDWLNQRTDSETQFFAVVAEVLQIDDSPPAFNLRPVVFPNEWQKAGRRATAGGVSERGEAYRVFFQGLIDELRERHHFTGARAGQPQNWYSFSSGYRGATLGASFALGGRVRVDLYIDYGDADENNELFEWLLGRRQHIEAELGQPLEWERLKDKRASRLALYRNGSIDDDPSDLAEIHSWVVQTLLRFKAVFDPQLHEYAASS